HFRGALLHLVGRYVLDVSRHAPAMSEGILELPGAVAVELVLHGTKRLRAAFDGAIEGLVDVLHVDAHHHRGTADRLRPAHVHLWVLVREHDHRVADLELRMTDPPVRPAHPHALRRAEDRTVERDRGARAVDAEIGTDLRVSFRNGFAFVMGPPPRGRFDLASPRLRRPSTTDKGENEAVEVGSCYPGRRCPRSMISSRLRCSWTPTRWSTTWRSCRRRSPVRACVRT